MTSGGSPQFVSRGAVQAGLPGLARAARDAGFLAVTRAFRINKLGPRCLSTILLALTWQATSLPSPARLDLRTDTMGDTCSGLIRGSPGCCHERLRTDCGTGGYPGLAGFGARIRVARGLPWPTIAMPIDVVTSIDEHVDIRVGAHIAHAA